MWGIGALYCAFPSGWEQNIFIRFHFHSEFPVILQDVVQTLSYSSHHLPPPFESSGTKICVLHFKGQHLLAEVFFFIVETATMSYMFIFLSLCYIIFLLYILVYFYVYIYMYVYIWQLPIIQPACGIVGNGGGGVWWEPGVNIGENWGYWLGWG